MAKEKKHKKTKSSEDIVKKISKNYWAFISIILVVIVIILLFGGNTTTSATITKQEAGDKILDFLEQRGTNATLVEVNEKDAMYEVVLEAEGQEGALYITRDGKNLVPTYIPLTGEVIQNNNEDISANENNNQQNQEEEIPKTQKPKVDLYVMSFCPYGNEAEDTIKPVYDLLKDKIDFAIHYIVTKGTSQEICEDYINAGYFPDVETCKEKYLNQRCVEENGEWLCSLHGEPESTQNIREICVLNQYDMETFFDFMLYVNENCGSTGDCWEDAAEQYNINTQDIEECVSNQGFELMEKETQAAEGLGNLGSPTFIINGEKSSSIYQYGKPEAYKQAICSAFTEDSLPSECSETLSSTGSTAAGGSC